MDINPREPVFQIYLVFVCFGLCKTTDQGCNGGKRNPVDCYECVSHGLNRFCSDPFNRSHPGLKTAKCDGDCVKWVKKPRNGVARYIRTCSSRLQLRISVALVCMKESPPEDGKLCFCHRDKCNGVDPSIHRYNLSQTITFVISLLISNLLLRYCGCDIISNTDDNTSNYNSIQCATSTKHNHTIEPTICSNTQRQTTENVQRFTSNVTSLEQSIKSELRRTGINYRNRMANGKGLQRESVFKKGHTTVFVTSSLIRLHNGYTRNCNHYDNSNPAERVELSKNSKSNNIIGSGLRSILPNRTQRIVVLNT